jgi:hypothetical protein
MNRTALGIAACAAIALTSALAPAQASATVLCTKQVTPCGGANVLPTGTQIKAALPALTTTVIENELVNVTCLENKIRMKTTTAGGGGFSVLGKIPELVFAQCTVPNGMGGSENCTVNPVHLGTKLPEEEYGANFQSGKNGNGLVSIAGGTLGAFGYSVVCNEKVEKINCTLTNSIIPAVTGGPGGGTPATISGAEKMNPVAGKKCPKAEATWKFTWAVSEPAAFFMEAE